MERKRWTDDDIAKLQSMARRYPTAQIAAALGRGISSTITKAHERRISLRINSVVPAEPLRRAGVSLANHCILDLAKNCVMKPSRACERFRAATRCEHPRKRSFLVSLLQGAHNSQSEDLTRANG